MIYRLYLGNLRRLDKNDITEAFEKFGKITDLWLATPPSGFGFLSFETPEEAEEAVRTMDGKDLHGTVIRVEFAKAPVGLSRFEFICRRVKSIEILTVHKEEVIAVDRVPIVEDTIITTVLILLRIADLALVLITITPHDM